MKSYQNVLEIKTYILKKNQVPWSTANLKIQLRLKIHIQNCDIILHKNQIDSLE